MREFRVRRNIRHLLYSPVTIVFLIVLLFFLARSVVGVYVSEQQSERERARAEREVADLKNRREFLSSQIDKLATPRGMEEELRAKFPVVKEGEEMVIIVQPEEGSTSSSPSSDKGFWAGVLNFFR